jgi:hypothetical protein
MDAQGRELAVLQAAVAKLGLDYNEMKKERDLYRQQKHEADDRLAGLSLRAQLAEREVLARELIIENLKLKLENISAANTTTVTKTVISPTVE